MSSMKTNLREQPQIPRSGCGDPRYRCSCGGPWQSINLRPAWVTKLQDKEVLNTTQELFTIKKQNKVFVFEDLQTMKIVGLEFQEKGEGWP